MLPERPAIRVSAAAAPAVPPPGDAALQAREALGDALVCPRCGYNLRGLTSDRCPECGLVCDWDAIIAAAKRQVEVPIFEYQWRDRPVAGFFGTLWLSLQPWRLWKRIPLTTEPRVGALLLFLSLTLPAFLIACLFFDAFSHFSLLGYFRYRRNTHYWPSWALFQSGQTAAVFLSHNLARYAVFAGIGLIAGLMLTVFHQSLLGHRVRRIHLLRIGVHVFACIIAVHLLNETVRRMLRPMAWLAPDVVHVVWIPVLVILDFAFLFLPMWSIVRSARDYLHVRRPWRFGVVVLLLSYACCLTFNVIYAVAVDSFENTLTEIDGETWPGIWYLAYYLSGVLGFR